MIISKEFKWIMGHRLSFHQGKCYTPHGHNYRVIIKIEGRVNENGILIDFEDISNIFKKNVFKILDHSFMIYNNDIIVKDFIMISEKLSKKGMKKFKLLLVNFETSAENIAKFIYEIMKKKIDNFDTKIVSVEVYETELAMASYYGVSYYEI